MSTAQTIVAQLGRITLAMIGAKNILDTGDGVQMKIGKNPKRWTHLTIELRGDDTYTVKLSRVRKFEVVSEERVHGVHADGLHMAIEQDTGLATRM